MASSFLLEELSQGHGRSLSQAAKLFPPFRLNRPVTLSCVFRWVTKGVRGPEGQRIRLEGARLAGRWVTTPQAIARFLQAQTPNLDNVPEQFPSSPNARQRANQRAAAKLEQLGL
jgi:hypothetical protein